MSSFDRSISNGMWRVVFFERRGYRIQLDRTGPWLPTKNMAQQWAQWFIGQGYHVAMQDQSGSMERLSPGLPG
jgi:hypothetical protein